MTPYQRLARETPGFEHWRLPVAAIAGGAVWALLNVAALAVMAVVLLASGRDLTQWLDSPDASRVALDDPLLLFVQLATLAVLVPIVLVSVRLVWPRHVGFVHSVEGRFRWRWFRRCLVLAFAVVGAGVVASVAVAIIAGDDATGFTLPGTAQWFSLAVVVLVVPLQAAGEEYLFRGALMQVLGSWTRWAWVPVLVTTVLFAAGHVYEFWGLVSVAVFGLVAAVLTIRTGGLEAPIALHVANNVVVMSFDLFGLVDSSGEGAGLLDEVVPTAVICVIVWALVEVAARRTRLQRRRPPLPDPVPPPRTTPLPIPPLGRTPVVLPPHAPVRTPQPPVVPPNAPPYPGDPGVWGR